jgi:hypothetical protein
VEVSQDSPIGKTGSQGKLGGKRDDQLTVAGVRAVRCWESCTRF